MNATRGASDAPITADLLERLTQERDAWRDLAFARGALLVARRRTAPSELKEAVERAIAAEGALTALGVDLPKEERR